MSDKEPLPAYRSHEFYVAIGKRGGKRRVEKHGVEAMRSIGSKGGQRTKDLNAKGRLYEQQAADGKGISHDTARLVDMAPE